MANIKKSYNFSNGFQIDDDNVVVNANGLVGFGTTIPTEVVDVYGNIKISASSQIPGAIGLLTCASIYTKRIEVEQNTILKSGSIGLASFTSGGIVTASNSALGGLAFFGDGAGLINIPTSQWVDVATGIAQSSSYAAGNVGIATNYPVFPLQVGGNNVVSGFGGGLGINRVGDVITPTGIITAAKFSGDGSTLTNLNASQLTSGTVSPDILPTIPNSKLSSDINLTGIITANQFSGQFIGTVTGNVVGIASTALSLTSDAKIDVLEITVGFATCGVATISKLDVARGGTSSNNATLGINTLTHRSDLHISKNSGIASALLTSSQNSYSLFTLGRNAGSQSGAMRFGFVGSASRKYSNANSLDIINNDTGSLNFYASNTDAKMFWLWDNQSEPAMTLISNGTNGGSLIIGAAGTTLLADERLRVSGILTVTSNAFVNGNLVVGGSINAGSVNISLDNKNINTTVTSGISTFYNTYVRNQLSIAGGTEYQPLVGTGFSAIDVVIGNWSAAPRTECVVLSDNGIGIGTTAPRYSALGFSTSIRLDALAANAIFRAVGVGSTVLSAAVDFSNAGNIGVGTNYRYMIVPKVPTNQLPSVGVQAGGIVYDTTSGTFKGYSGSSWTDFAAAGTTGSISVTENNPTSGGSVTRYIFFGDNTSGTNQTVKADPDLTYDPRTNTLTAGTFSGNFSGSITDATNASNVALTASNTSSAFKIPFANTTGNADTTTGLLIDNGSTFTYNPLSNTLTAGNFVGNGSGLTGVTASPSYTQNSQSGAYTLQSTDKGKYIDYTPTTGGGGGNSEITLSSTLAASPGQQVIIYVNNAAGGGALPAKLVPSGVSLYYAGNSVSVTRIEMDRNAVLTLLCVGTDSYVAYGTGLTAVVVP